MPKLSQDIIEANKERIESAAKEFFIRQGFHATSMRDIASRAQTSLGNLYNYYRTKEAILESIIMKYQKGKVFILEGRKNHPRAPHAKKRKKNK